MSKAMTPSLPHHVAPAKIARASLASAAEAEVPMSGDVAALCAGISRTRHEGERKRDALYPCLKESSTQKPRGNKMDVRAASSKQQETH